MSEALGGGFYREFQGISNRSAFVNRVEKAGCEGIPGTVGSLDFRQRDF